MELGHKSITLRSVRLKKRNEGLRKRINQVKNLRLFFTGIFLTLLFLSTINTQWRLEVYIVSIYAIIFFFLLFKTRRLERFLKFTNSLQKFYERQSLRVKGQPCSSSIWSDKDNFTYEDDLGILGEHSVYHLVDETFSEEGKEKLTSLLTNPEVFEDSITTRQKKIQEMGNHHWFWIRFLLTGGSKERRVSFHKLKELFKASNHYANRNYFMIQMVLWSTWLLALFTQAQFAALLWGVYFVWTFLKISLAVQSFAQGESLLVQIRSLRPVLEFLEKSKRLSSEYFPFDRFNVNRGLRKIETYLSFLSIQANPIIFIIFNAVLPWSSFFSFLLEKKKRNLADEMDHVCHQVSYWESLASLSLLWAYHTRVFPQEASQKTFLIEKGFHPLLDRETVVSNSLSLQGKKVVVLTGSNMSGKSTFLRSIGLNQTLYRAGAPVFAQKMEAWPFPVLSCIKVSDSVRDGISYFQSEVLHLKELLQKAKNQPHIYLIDEIFRGTNNKERFQGSYALILALAKTQSLGLVSTHDLELSSLEEKDDNITNYHFSDSFIDDEMIFSYKLEKGPCRSTNALKIMEMYGLPTS